MRIFIKLYIATALTILLPMVCGAQAVSSIVSRADRQRQLYDFEGASKLYNQALESAQEPEAISELAEKINWCENGASMLQYATKPVVLQTKRFKRSDF